MCKNFVLQSLDRITILMSIIALPRASCAYIIAEIELILNFSGNAVTGRYYIGEITRVAKPGIFPGRNLLSQKSPTFATKFLGNCMKSMGIFNKK